MGDDFWGQLYPYLRWYTLVGVWQKEGGGVEADLAKIYKLVLNKRIKSVYLVPLVNNIRWKMISGVNSTHICDDLALWESDEEMVVGVSQLIWLKYLSL